MTKQEFIEQIATYVKKYAASYGIAVHSPIIAQAILESHYGTSELAVNANNFFGLKYREGRCKTSIGVYHKVGSEQNADGSYTSSAMKWCKFADMENGVVGYFDFLNISNYSNLKGVSDPETYLKNIKSDGYATSLNYVDNLMAVIKNWDLTKYDVKKESEIMGNSSLVDCTVKSPNHSGKRTHSIDRITPHCVVGQLTAANIGGCFTSSSRQASCNYGIGSDGKVCLIVDECNRSWCSSSNANDQRAVTIECASDKTEPYAFTDTVYKKLVDLCVDICRRNGKNTLLWFGDKDKTLAYEPKGNEMVLTVHRWFANKSCPGNWMYARMGDLASKVTAALGGTASTTTPAPAAPATSNVVTSFPPVPFTVQVLIDDLNYRSAPSMSGTVKGQTRKNVFTIVEVKDGWGRLKSGVGWIYLENPAYCTVQGSVPVQSGGHAVPYKVRVSITDLNIRKGHGTDTAIVQTCPPNVYTIVEEATGKGATMWGKLKSGIGWISLDYVTKV